MKRLMMFGVRLVIRLFQLVFNDRTERVTVPEYRSNNYAQNRKPLSATMRDKIGAVTGKPVMLQTSDFAVADRIVSMRLDPPVGSLHMRIFSEQKVIKRELIITEPKLKSIMRGRRFNLADAIYEPEKGLEDVKDETVALAEKLINEVGNRRVKAIKPPVVEKPKEIERKAKPEAVEVEKPKPKALPVNHEPIQAQKPAKEFEGKVFAPRVTTGITYQGMLMRAGSKRMTPQNRDPYEVFEAVLLLDNGAELPLRGAELEREITTSGCKVGQRLAITPMGKVPVTLASGAEGSKNLYKVQGL